MHKSEEKGSRTENGRDMMASNEAQISRVRNWYCHGVKVRWDKCQK